MVEVFVTEPTVLGATAGPLVFTDLVTLVAEDGVGVRPTACPNVVAPARSCVADLVMLLRF